jgi:DNA replication initiation complex subunit (GINS family)
MTDKDQVNQNKALFVNMISMLTMSAMQQLGKIINPETGKAEINLEAAQAVIDMLDMLNAKTQGNLDEEERKMLADTLTMLKLNYVETSKQAKAEDKKAQQPGTEKQSAEAKSPAEDTDKPQPEAPEAEPQSEAKFHKSYG